MAAPFLSASSLGPTGAGKGEKKEKKKRKRGGGLMAVLVVRNGRFKSIPNGLPVACQAAVSCRSSTRRGLRTKRGGGKKGERRKGGRPGGPGNSVQLPDTLKLNPGHRGPFGFLPHRIPSPSLGGKRKGGKKEIKGRNAPLDPANNAFIALSNVAGWPAARKLHRPASPEEKKEKRKRKGKGLYAVLLSSNSPLLQLKGIRRIS